jgi:para-aminobenzoate synthetase
MVTELAGASTEANSSILLDSAAKPGRYSIVGFLSTSSPKIAHYVGEKFVTLHSDGSVRREHLTEGGVWLWMAAFMETRRAEGGNKDIPFWGGLVGYLSYELGCTNLGSKVSRGHGEHPNQHADVNMAFVERSVVLDLATGRVYIQSIIPKDETWINGIAKSLSALAKRPYPSVQSEDVPSIQTANIILPDQQRYLARIRMAKEHLAVGNSYELCLTAGTKVKLSRSGDTLGSSTSSTSWELYKNLRKRNPAPHSAYIRLHPSTLLSSSPERFLSYSRPPNSLCQLRPIKGTLRKTPYITRADAERGLVGNVKEVAENLMIVDLIRHDLHGVVGEDVEVKQFCTVEEYETVWQMTSVIEGKPSLNQRGTTPRFDQGWRVLRECLPPGSMTGAPKKRSVEILRELEDEPRGIYSGVLGYWDVGGGGDWAVTIRTCFKHDDSPIATRPSAGARLSEEKPMEQWCLGAGGAITALSDPASEWDEMILKLQSVLGIFKENS